MTTILKTLNIRGKDLYVEIHGSEDAYPLLYLHGGPGEGCYEFCQHQGQRLQDDFRLIAIDQRGVQRSAEIKEDEPFSLDDLVEDCEVLRQKLGIEKWALLGHSFGGYIAVKYALRYAESVSHIIFECPTFDFGLSSRSLFRKMAKVAEKENENDLAKECLQLAQSHLSPKELLLKFVEMRPELGEKGKEIHIHHPDYYTDFSHYTDEEWRVFFNRSNVHTNRLLEEEKMFESLLPKLSGIQQPTLLIRGQYDPVTCKMQLENYAKDIPNGQVITFQNSGHFPHSEEPAEFTKVIVGFLVGQSHFGTKQM